MVNIENVFKGGVRKTLLEWAERQLSPVICLIMATKKKKTRTKKKTKCRCYNGWVCEDQPDQPWNHRGCGAAGESCKNPRCDKDPDSVFVLGQPGRRKPPVRQTSLNARGARRFRQSLTARSGQASPRAGSQALCLPGSVMSDGDK